jgi:hypothetical protein
MIRLLLPLLLLAAAHSWAQLPIEILRATYGAGRTQADVTDKVRSYLVNGAIQFEVRAETLGGDPVPNTPKSLTVLYRQGNQRQTVRVNDFETLRLGISLKITKAVYGDGRRMQDVTGALNAKLNGNRLELAITNVNLGGDPAPAVKKSITVDYEFNGVPATARLAEGQTLILPPAATAVAPVSTLRILRATYAAGRRNSADVTNALAARVVNGAVALTVNGESLGGDPAPGFVKTLTVEYELNGARRTATAQDGQTLRLP